MFIRFITQFKNDNGEIETGVFQAAAFIRGNSETYNYDIEILENIRDWFNYHLEKPERFSKSKRKNAENISISWFKSSSKNHLLRMYEMKVVLEKYDIIVEVVKKENPGTIVYEDEFQVSAIPFRTDRVKVV